ncbi:hypothetical protein, partial [Enterobacter intestinihominis]
NGSKHCRGGGGPYPGVQKSNTGRWVMDTPHPTLKKPRQTLGGLISWPAFFLQPQQNPPRRLFSFFKNANVIDQT